jgi:hypothetical protein
VEEFIQVEIMIKKKISGMDVIINKRTAPAFGTSGVSIPSGRGGE